VLAVGTVRPFMIWNLYLAFIPAVLALALFRRSAHLGPVWFAGLATWLVFLPNAPYVLTDVVHLVADIRASDSRAHDYAVLLTYAVFFGAGLVSYVVSMQLFRGFLHRVAPRRTVRPALLLVHGVCIVAMYVGHFMRLNSWDVLVAPRTVLDSVMRVPHPTSVVVLAVMFVVVGVGSYVTAAVGDKALAEVRRFRTR